MIPILKYDCFILYFVIIIITKLCGTWLVGIEMTATCGFAVHIF